MQSWVQALAISRSDAIGSDMQNKRIADQHKHNQGTLDKHHHTQHIRLSVAGTAHQKLRAQNPPQGPNHKRPRLPGPDRRHPEVGFELLRAIVVDIFDIVALGHKQIIQHYYDGDYANHRQTRANPTIHQCLWAPKWHQQITNSCHGSHGNRCHD